jgi:hypothetical protein
MTLFFSGVVLDLAGDTGTGPHLNPAWIPASAGMTVGAELSCVPPRLWFRPTALAGAGSTPVPAFAGMTLMTFLDARKRL